MIDLNSFINGFTEHGSLFSDKQPWEITNDIIRILQQIISELRDHPDYYIENDIAIHKTAVLEKNIVLKGPVIIKGNCFVAAHAYFREGVYLDNNVKIGPGCEIKSSFIFEDSAMAHFNYIGNSIIGNNVNFEAGAIAANHYNERVEKKISVNYNSEVIRTDTTKFGALVGDGSRIGANAVLSPGTILERNSIVRRLELIEQMKEKS